jgi:5-methylcytosine-specific restriction protein A
MLFPGCPELTDGRFCPSLKSWKHSGMKSTQRDPATKKRYGHAWKRSATVYRSAPIVRGCQKAGKLTPAEEVHHIVPLAAGGTTTSGT